jgi:glycosyltransferase involved in cell wall biosynthesis
MKIGFNLISLRVEQHTGVETYTRNLVGSLNAQKNQTFLIALRNKASLSMTLGEKFFSNNPLTTLSQWSVNSTVLRIPLEMIILSLRMFTFDRILSVNNFGPLFEKRGQKRFVIIPDLWFLDKSYNGSVLLKYLFYLLIRIQLLSTDHIITVSQFSKKRIINLLSVNLEIITVLPNCLSLEDLNTEYPIDRDSILNHVKLNLNKQYFLLLGSDRANKNIQRALEGYVKYCELTGTPYELILVGPFSTSFIDLNVKKFDKNILDRITIAGYVSDEKYKSFIKYSSGIVFPSLYEGFGIPVLESIAFNKKILISKGTVCEEIAGEFGISVDGNCVESISMGYLLLQNQKPKTKHSNHKSNLYFDCSSIGNQLQECLFGPD